MNITKVNNIHQVVDFTQLKTIVSSNPTVVLGLVCPTTSKSDKIMIKKFLKRKSEIYSLIQFVYFDLTKSDIENTGLEIVYKDYDAYPLVYHIRDHNKIACEVVCATIDSLKESFEALEPYYIKDQEKANSKIEPKIEPKSIQNIELDSQTKILINKKKKEALESELSKAQKKLFSEIKARIKLEQK